MSRQTPGTQLLHRLGVAFELHAYDYDAASGRIGLHAARALGVDAGRVFKTLMVSLDGRGGCIVLPSDREASLKKVARAFGVHTARMMTKVEAERASGYVIGGVSPFGQRRRVPVIFDSAVLEHERIFINAGRRGLLAELSPAAAIEACAARTAAITQGGEG